MLIVSIVSAFAGFYFWPMPFMGLIVGAAFFFSPVFGWAWWVLAGLTIIFRGAGFGRNTLPSENPSLLFAIQTFSGMAALYLGPLFSIVVIILHFTHRL